MEKILIISFSNLPNFQSSLYNTYKSMNELNKEVYTIGSNNITANGIDISKKNLLYTVSKNPMPTISSIKLLNRTLRDICSEIKKINPDCIHFISKHTWNYFIIKSIRNEVNSKIVHTFHDPIGHTGEIRRFGVILYNKLIGNNVDSLIVHSDKSKYETEKYIKPKCKVYKAPLGEMMWKDFVESKEFKKNILIFGRLNPYKGCDLISGIAKELKDKDPNIVITVAGKASNDVKEEIIHKIEDCENIKFINEFINDDELSSYFYSSDIVLITHRSITQSGVILQAYRHSKAIVSFDIEGIREFTEDKKTGLISEAYDEKKYVDNIIKLYDDLKVLNEYNFNAWKFGKEKFSNEIMVKKIIEIYCSEAN